MKRDETIYIGDGVYVTWDGYYFILKAGENKIFLDFSVAMNLMDNVKETFSNEESNE